MPAIAKTAFVIMPIGTDGTPEHAYFKALYADYVRPVLAQEGFAVSRADETALSGAITKDIMTHIGRADLVVADLTSLNPNVFYEIGVRHSLRRNGTVLILDEAQTPDIPFDLTGYRAILFRGDLAGAAELQRQLLTTLTAITQAPGEHSDNPVHDWLPMLPTNAVAASSDTEAGELREELANAQRRLADYQRRLGESAAYEPPDVSALSVVAKALRDARDGNLTPDLVKDAEACASENKREGFLAVINKILERELLLEDEIFIRLAAHASRLDLRDVSLALYDHASALYPTSTELRTRRLMHLTHSPAASDRQLARTELLNQVGISVTDMGVTVPTSLDEEAARQIAVMLDAYHQDDLDSEALALTTALVKDFGDRSTIARNHARALERSGAADEDAVDWYSRSVKCSDVNDLSATFFGSALHNKHRNVDALEPYCLGAMLDPGDGERFAYIASEIAYAVQGQLTGSDKSGRVLPDTIGEDTVQTAIVAACSCDEFTQAALDRCVNATKIAELPGGFLPKALALRDTRPDSDSDGSMLMRLQERYAFASNVYEVLRSELTTRQS